jgi:hypothetical protein
LRFRVFRFGPECFLESDSQFAVDVQNIFMCFTITETKQLLSVWYEYIDSVLNYTS